MVVVGSVCVCHVCFHYHVHVLCSYSGPNYSVSCGWLEGWELMLQRAVAASCCSELLQLYAHGWHHWRLEVRQNLPWPGAV